jgi:hypothetical protein
MLQIVAITIRVSPETAVPVDMMKSVFLRNAADSSSERNVMAKLHGMLQFCHIYGSTMVPFIWLVFFSTFLFRTHYSLYLLIICEK